MSRQHQQHQQQQTKKKGLEHYFDDDSDDSSWSSSSSSSTTMSLSSSSFSLRPSSPPPLITISHTSSSSQTNNNNHNTPKTKKVLRRMSSCPPKASIERMPSSSELQSDDEEAIMLAAASLSPPMLRKSLTSLTSLPTPTPMKKKTLRRSSSKLSVASLSCSNKHNTTSSSPADTKKMILPVIRRHSRRFSSPANAAFSTCVKRRNSLPLSTAVDLEKQKKKDGVEKLNDSWGSDLRYDSDSEAEDDSEHDNDENGLTEMLKQQQIDLVIGSGAALVCPLQPTEKEASTTRVEPKKRRRSLPLLSALTRGEIYGDSDDDCDNDKTTTSTNPMVQQQEQPIDLVVCDGAADGSASSPSNQQNETIENSDKLDTARRRWSMTNIEKDCSKTPNGVARQRYLKALSDYHDVENGNNALLHHDKNPFLVNASSDVELKQGDKDEQEEDDSKMPSSKKRKRFWNVLTGRVLRSRHEKENMTCPTTCTTSSCTPKRPRHLFTISRSISITELFQIFLLFILLYLMYDSKTKIDLATSSLTKYQSEENTIQTQLASFQNRAKELNEQVAMLTAENRYLQEAVKAQDMENPPSGLRKLGGNGESSGTAERAKGKMRMVLDDDDSVGDDDGGGTIATADAAANMRAKRIKALMEQQDQMQKERDEKK